MKQLCAPVGSIPEPGYLEILVSQYPNFNDKSYTMTPQDKEAMMVVSDDGSTEHLVPRALQYVDIVC